LTVGVLRKQFYAKTRYLAKIDKKLRLFWAIFENYDLIKADLGVKKPNCQMPVGKKRRKLY